MTESQTFTMPVVGGPGERCVECDTLLAPDQRYCLSCGRRRGPLRVPFAEALGGEAPGGPAAPADPPPPAGGPASESARWRPGPAWLAAAAALLLLALGVGALVGRGTVHEQKAQAPAPIRITFPKQQITVAAAPTAAAPAATTATFTSDWPADKKGWTVQLQKLSKDSSDPAAVAAAKTAATSQGATDVGALDSDDFPSLDGGDYVIYAGIDSTKSAAKTALKGLKSKFPDAKVISVDPNGTASTAKTTKQLNSLQNSSGNSYEQKSKKLPSKISTGGKPPAKDKKKAGGGSSGTTIG